MTRNISRIAKRLGVSIEARIPDTGGGAFGMARLVKVLTARLQPSRGRRPGRPTDPSWESQGKVPMSAKTKKQLEMLADRMSDKNRRVSPMQVAAQLLEDSVAQLADTEL